MIATNDDGDSSTYIQINSCIFIFIEFFFFLKIYTDNNGIKKREFYKIFLGKYCEFSVPIFFCT